MVRVAVLIPTYNRHELLERAVRSALKADVEVEVLVGDDGSDPPVSVDLPKVKVFRFDHTGNPSYVRNRLALLTDAPFITFLDDDDEYLEGKIERQVMRMERTGAPATMCNVLVLDKTGRGMGLAYGRSEKPLRERILYPFSREGVIPQVGSLMLRREVFLDLGGFNERLTLLEDWEFSLRLVLRYGLDYEDFPGLAHYMNREDSLRRRQEELGLRERVLEEIRGYAPHGIYKRVSSNLYAFLSDMARRRGRRRDALLYALRSLLAHPNGRAAFSLLTALLPRITL